MALPSTRHEAFQKEVRGEVGSGLSTKTCTQSVDEVGADCRYHRSDVYLAFLAGFDVILSKDLESCQYEAESASLLHPLQESAHAGFAARKVYFAVLLPELIVL